DCRLHNPHRPAPAPGSLPPGPLGESAPAQFGVWFETGSAREHPLAGHARHRWPRLLANTGETQSADWRWGCSPINSPPPGSCLACLPARNTAALRRPNECPSWETRYHPRSTPEPAPWSSWRTKRSLAPVPEWLHRSRAHPPPNGVKTDAYGARCPAPAGPPSAPRSFVPRATTTPRSRPSTVL